MPDIIAIAAYLNHLLQKSWYSSEENTLYRPSKRPIKRIGLALAPFPTLADRVVTDNLDAIFLHRPWKVNLTHLPDDLGILMSHRPFDDHLTLGYNPWLASVISMSAPLPFGEHDGRPLGMIADCPPRSLAEIDSIIREIFGGVEEAHPGPEITIDRIAAVGAMTDILVREADAVGAKLYLTGQFRQPARAAVAKTGISVIAVGHRRSEIWGLNLLADLLQNQWPEMETLVLGVD